jgi:hypothetical protein
VNGYDDYEDKFKKWNARILEDVKAYDEELPKAKKNCDIITFIWIYLDKSRKRIEDIVDEGTMTSRVHTEQAVLYGTKGHKLADEKVTVDAELKKHIRDWDTSVYYLHTYADPLLNTVRYKDEEKDRSTVATTMNALVPPRGHYNGLATCLWKEFWLEPPAGKKPGRGRISFVVEEPEIVLQGPSFSSDGTRNKDDKLCCTLKWLAAQLFVNTTHKKPPKDYTPVP